MPRLAQAQERYLHSPRLVSDVEGGATLYAIAWQGAEERTLRWSVAPDGALGEAQEGPARPYIVALGRGSVVSEIDHVRAELEEQRDGYRVWVEHREGLVSVKLARANGDDEVLVFRARGSALSPTLASAAGGVWIAFHHDVREDTGQADIAKWVGLRFVDHDGAVFEPAASMQGRDRDAQGVEQSFEFPALVLGDDGALALFGRGSHNFWRQDLSAAGFGPRQPLSDGEWGSRGRQVAAARVRDGIIVARRDRRGLEVDLLPHVTGGAPRLSPARVDWLGPRSSPATAARDPAENHGMCTLFGDIQQHSAHSDGLGSAHEAYLRARDRYADDFVALTDHEAFLGKRTGPGEWEYLQRVAEHYDAPGQFATLYAYEWTGKAFPGPGHKCVYFPTRGFPVVSRDDVPEGKALVARIRALGGFASPHHIGWTGADEPGHDDLGQPLWEICSCHGCYEYRDHPLGQRGELRDQMADEMLRRGHRFGFTASSDSHGLLYHHGEARKRDPYRTGLTAVQARARTREAIMQALVARRCYATSGAKIALDVTADGAPMGTALDDRSSAEFQVEVSGTEVVASIELVGAEGVLARSEPNAREASFHARVGSRFVYARITQRDGEMAWSSPVFLGIA
ncbi:MAG TPA: CehA/McbA family metallohydrolase [Polyangiales bacterium]